MSITLQEEPIQSLFSDESEGIQEEPLKVNLYFVIIGSFINKKLLSQTKKDQKVTCLYFCSTHK